MRMLRQLSGQKTPYGIATHPECSQSCASTLGQHERFLRGIKQQQHSFTVVRNCSTLAAWSLDHADLLEGIPNFNLSPVRLNKRGSEFCQPLLDGCVAARIADCVIGKIVHVRLDLLLNTLSQSRQINFLGFRIHTRRAIITDETRASLIDPQWLG